MSDPAVSGLAQTRLHLAAETFPLSKVKRSFRWISLQYPGVFAVARDRGAGAAILLSSPFMFNNVKEAAELSLRHRLPAITLFSEFPRTGRLLSYGPSLLGATKQAGALPPKCSSERRRPTCRS